MIDEIKNIASKKTIITVTHRLSTIKFCDKIIVLKAGRIVDFGTYRELQSNSKIFNSFVASAKNKSINQEVTDS